MPLSGGAGTGMATLAAVVMVAALVLTIAANPAARAALGRVWQRLKDNPVRTYLYGPPTAPDHPQDDSSAAPADEDDGFDYSIFTVPQPGPDQDR